MPKPGVGFASDAEGGGAKCLTYLLLIESRAVSTYWRSLASLFDPERNGWVRGWGRFGCALEAVEEGGGERESRRKKPPEVSLKGFEGAVE